VSIPPSPCPPAETDFNDKEQNELGLFVDRITEKNAKVVISNSDPKNSDNNDTFFDDLYSSYKIVRVTAKRMINCNGKSRGNISELLISNC
jgi:DNA adenine methylase